MPTVQRENLSDTARRLAVTIDTEVPDEITTLILPLIREEMWLLPTWVHNLHVRFTTPTDDNTSMSSSVNETYRHGTLFVHPIWLMADSENRRNDLRHEFIHFPLDGLYEAALEALRLVDNEQVRTTIKDRLRLAMEHAVCDLEHAVSTLRQ